MDTRTKILRLEQALAAAAQLRREGRALRLAAGGFDVLQAAHAEFLSGLRSDGDALLVAVFDDASLSRPVLPEQARAQLVASLRAVDYVLVWPESRLGELRDELQVARIESVPLAGRNIIGEVLDRHK
jgi:bifunctional ADP-heptose synthase (sugar kinase/adenylyltransferase)